MRILPIKSQFKKEWNRMTEIEVLQLKVEDYAETIVELEMQCKEQKAEIERLQKEKFNSLNSQFAEMYATTLKIATKKAKSEAIKKFAHQLKILLETKATLYSLSDKECEFAIVQSAALKTVDNLVKEMTEKE